MKYNLQQEIAHFFREFGVIAAFERVQDFVCFLDQIGPKRRVRLFPVPGTAVRRAKPGLQRDQLLEPLSCGQPLLS